MQDDKDDLTGKRKIKGCPNLQKKRDPTPLGDTVVPLGKMIVYYHVDSERWLNGDKPFSDTS